VSDGLEVGLAILGVAAGPEAIVQRAYSFRKAVRRLVAETLEWMTGIAAPVTAMAVKWRIW
jgi:hypothetical protein